MSSRYYSRQADDAMDLSEDNYSFDDTDDAQRVYNDTRLRQAINYMAEQGGDDSAATFISRVNRIDEALLQLLPQTGDDFDGNLYQEVCAMVDEVHEVYDNALTQDDHQIDGIPEYYTPSALEALHRPEEEEESSESDSSIPPVRPSMSSKPAIAKKIKSPAAIKHPLESHVVPAVRNLAPRFGNAKNNVERERTWTYGEHEQVEEWYRDMPASFPFADSHQMEHWETLKINFDLSDHGKKLKAEGKVVETDIPFDHPALAQYKTLPRFESGSRFKLPAGTPEDQVKIRKLATRAQLVKAVREFNEGNTGDARQDLVPRIFLDKFIVGAQDEPMDVTTAIRGALSATPTKSSKSSVLSTPRNSGTRPEVLFVDDAVETASRRSSMKKAQQLRAEADALEAQYTKPLSASKSTIQPSSSSSTKGLRSTTTHDLAEDIAAQKQAEKLGEKFDKKHKSALKALAENTPTRFATGSPADRIDRLNKIMAEQRALTASAVKSTPPARPTTRAGAAMRKFGTERTQAISHSPRRESLEAGAISTPEDPFTTVPKVKVTPKPTITKPTMTKPTITRPKPTASTSKIPTPTSHEPTTPTSAKSSSSTVPLPPAKSQTPIPTPSSTPPKRGRGRPRKTPSTTPTPDRKETARKTATPSSTSTKRKLSVGSEHYTPDGKRKKSLGSEDYMLPLVKKLRSSSSTTPKKVGFAEVSNVIEISSGEEETSSDDEDSDSLSEGDSIAVVSPVPRPVVKRASVAPFPAAHPGVKTAAVKPTTSVKSSVVTKDVPGGSETVSVSRAVSLAKPGVLSKAAVAGLQARRKVVREEKTVVETTRMVRKVGAGVEDLDEEENEEGEEE
ncbi:hypothetical protein NX059_005457 [Plenodomus lindquistii]|nr:hypothetical protein NX059_005457 [Plenodomus lindquistii]